MRWRRVRVRRFWMCTMCGRSFFLIGKLRDVSAPNCVHTGTHLEGDAAPCTMIRLGVGTTT